jgi:FkbM family methyltransferase
MLLDRIRTASRAFGVDLKRYSPMCRVIDILSKADRKPFFVQIGANNGTDFDNFYEAVTANRLDGIVIEPVADYHEALRQAYARYPGVTPLRAAIHPSAETITMYRVASDRVEWLWQHGIASFERAHLIAHGIAEDAILAEEVPCLSIGALLQKIPAGRTIDILTMDTEGFDVEILRMIDFSVIHPKILRFEDKHMDAADRVHFRRVLEREGYAVTYLAGDAIAIDRSVAYGPLAYLRKLWR